MIVLLLLIASTLLMKFFQENTHILSGAAIVEFGCPRIYIDDSLALQPLGYMLSSIISGIFGDLLGMRRILLLSIGMAFGASLTIGCTPDITNIKIARFILGIGMGGVNCCAYALIKNLGNDNHLRAVISKSYTALFASAAIYPLVTKYMIAWCSWRYVMLLGSLMSFAIGTSLFVMLPATHTKPESMRAYLEHAAQLLSNPAFLRCCLIACLTTGHTYALQAMTTAYNRTLPFHIDQPVLQSIGRVFMVAGAVYANRTTTPLSQLSWRGALGILSGCALSVGAVFTDFKDAMMLGAMIIIFCLGFLVSYATVGVAQTASKTEMLMLAGAFPGIAQGLVSACASSWEAVGTKLIYSIAWPLAALAYFALALLCGVTVRYLLARGVRN
jgi:MFS family permease